MLVGSIALPHTACTISYIKPAFVLKERKVCVQSTVEAPYLYLLARSASSVKDQILYVPTRLEDIQELEQNLTIDGQEYCDKLRFFSGDTPARALEAGHQCNGRHTT